MKFRINAWRPLVVRAVVAALWITFAPVGWVHAATVNWTGLGSSDLWSDPLNWTPLGPPADGDDLIFSALPPRATSVLDASRSFSSISFAADAGAFFLHVSGDGSSALELSGAGLRNLTAGTGPIRQALFADAGSSGGTLRFSADAGVNLGLGFSARAVDLTAVGASASGQAGGHIVFQDRASVGTDTFDALRVEGAAAGGAAAADIVFRGNALADRFSTIAVAGGLSTSALGGAARFSDTARAAGTVNVLAGVSGGAGGRVDFAGNAVLAVTASLSHQGAASAALGAEAATVLRGDARMMGSAQNGEGRAAGASGGRLEFFDRASYDTSELNPSLGTQIVGNSGSSTSGAGGGTVVFHDDSFVRGTQLFILNATSESAAAGTLGGSTTFMDRARAGAVSIENAGTRGSSAVGGSTRFFNQANAESASIVMRGGNGGAATGGSLSFGEDTRAGSATLRNEGGAAVGALGGSTLFQGRASADHASIVNTPGAIGGASGGVTRFAGNAGAGNAYIRNENNPSASGGGRGTTAFTESSSAQNATIDNQGGIFTINAFTMFSQSATAGNALITNFGGQASGVAGGTTYFNDQSTAGSATLLMLGGAVHGALGGQAVLVGSVDAGQATFDLRAAAVVGAEGGNLLFQGGASAGSATVRVQGSQLNNAGGPEAAVVRFTLAASASNAAFFIGGNVFASGGRGRVVFSDGATAADASFITLAGFDVGGRLSFEGSAAAPTTAGNARITNASRLTPSTSNGSFGGATTFLTHSSADHATITNEAGLTSFGAQTVFRADSTAADASIVNAGGPAGQVGGITFFQDSSSAGRAVIVSAAGAFNATGQAIFYNTSSAGQAGITAAGASVNGDFGGRMVFDDSSTAAQATLVAEGGRNGGGGGRIEFRRQATGGTARVVLNAGDTADAGGTLDIGGVDVWLSVGSIEGGGLVNLGARALLVAGNAQATTFSGVISGGTPPVFPSLAILGGSLTLTGANVYTGRTTIGDGLNAHSGKLVAANTTGSATGSGAVLIQRGGTLAGSGFIAGAVTLLDGGTIEPGDPVTLTLRDSLVWDGGGVIRLVIGADDAGSDHLVVHRLVRGMPGSFTFEFIDAGFTAGGSYALLHFDEIEGFVADDFSFVGLNGSFSLVNGTLGFTATVPEPGAGMLLGAGLCWLWRVRQRRPLAASA